ncbi:MAG: recombination protein NinG [Candidatus Delongbacteria bacterium]|nr:recombination protein NinG [Candidatus Delongbacteria bacterium]
MKELKKSICKGTGKKKGFGCGTQYTKTTSLYGNLCNKCYIEWLKQADKDSVNKYINYAVKQSNIRRKKEDKDRKKDLLTKSELEGKLQDMINKIVRLIDADKGCISCSHGWETKFTRQRHAGHRHSVGSNHSLRFNLFNEYVQCSICNNYLSGNEREYDKGLLKHYGQESLDILEREKLKYKDIKLTRGDLEGSIIMARKIVKELLSGCDYSRSEINYMIGIYV